MKSTAIETLKLYTIIWLSFIYEIPRSILFWICHYCTSKEVYENIASNKSIFSQYYKRPCNTPNLTYCRSFSKYVCITFQSRKSVILTQLAYRANAKTSDMSNKSSVLKAQGKHVLAEVICYCKMTSVVALDSVTSLLSWKDVTNTCKPMRHSPTIGGISSVQWRQVGRSWILQMYFRRLLCVRIEIDQLYCVNCWVIIHCLSVSCTRQITHATHATCSWFNLLYNWPPNSEL